MASDELKKTAPVVIGCVGGSGSRMLADVVGGCGHFMGYDLNGSNDCQFFSFLFRRHGVLRHDDPADFDRRLSIFSRAALGATLSPADMTYVLRLYLDDGTRRTDPMHGGEGKNAARRVKKMLGSFARKSHLGQPWGFKSPISSFYIPRIMRFFPKGKYIHLLRHGLDMAFSTNLQQVTDFGPLFGVDVKKDAVPTPEQALQFWVRTTRRVMDYGRELGPERFLLVRYDDMVTNPRQEVDRIADFVGGNLSEDNRRELAALPRVPGSFHRYRNHDISMFDPAHVEFVRNAGFAVEGA